jgi:hypothetical protein
MKLKTIKIIIAAFSLFTISTNSYAEDALKLQITIKDHKFEPAELKVPANKPIILMVKNLDATPEEFESKSLKIEKVIAGGAQATINIRPLEIGKYKFVGEFNEKTAQGVIVVE